jgi:hypothetical protein
MQGFDCGGDKGTRTPDFHNAIVTLYQLSYIPKIYMVLYAIQALYQLSYTPMASFIKYIIIRTV